jgi:hypothetical protein
MSECRVHFCPYADAPLQMANDKKKKHFTVSNSWCDYGAHGGAKNTAQYTAARRASASLRGANAVKILHDFDFFEVDGPFECCQAVAATQGVN